MDVHPETMRQDARRAFPGFYQRAEPYERDILDALLFAHCALVVGFNAPRPHMSDPAREVLERVTDETERAFMHLREAVRQCPAFDAVGNAERRAIETTLFRVPSVGSDFSSHDPAI